MQCFWGGVCNESAHCTICNQGKIVQAIDIEDVRLACWVLLNGQNGPFSLNMTLETSKCCCLKDFALWVNTFKKIMIGSIAKKQEKLVVRWKTRANVNPV